MSLKEAEIKLDTKLVGDIEGHFFIPSYQRGYRWGEKEVTRLLNDIYKNGVNNYCLQPVVLRNNGDSYELIDGQQRLTTLFILLRYIQKEFKPRIKVKYDLAYETRSDSAAFLKDIDESKAESNIDYFHIVQAYRTIDAWFKRQKDEVVAADDMYGYLAKNVKVIWYEVGKSEDAIGLFTRLNIGKIPLTSGELVKAMFLSTDLNSDMSRARQQEIALQWDSIEKELHNDSLWYFLTNSYTSSYQTRVDLILDLIAETPKDNKEKYYTFYKFDEMRSTENLQKIWQRIQHTFLTLRNWYEDHDLYHRIGYLIAADAATLQEIYQLSVGKTKTAFHAALEERIKTSIKISTNYAELSYEKSADYDKISRLLLLFNVESVRQIDGKTQRFPFDQYKYQKNGKIVWSLEHIHAQNSESIRTEEFFRKWLELHIPSVEALKQKDQVLLDDLKAAVQKKTIGQTTFENLHERVVAVLSTKGSTEYLHSISNMALLSAGDNAALNNATFDVKRNDIIRMDKEGKFIPYCTKMVFLKYYTPSDKNQLQFWGQPDRIAYVENINRVLEKYLEEKITLEKRDD